MEKIVNAEKIVHKDWTNVFVIRISLKLMIHVLVLKVSPLSKGCAFVYLGSTCLKANVRNAHFGVKSVKFQTIHAPNFQLPFLVLWLEEVSCYSVWSGLAFG